MFDCCPYSLEYLRILCLKTLENGELNWFLYSSSFFYFFFEKSCMKHHSKRFSQKNQW